MNSSTRRHRYGGPARASRPAGHLGMGIPGVESPLVIMLVLVAVIALLAGCSSEEIKRLRAYNAELGAALVVTEAELADAQTHLATIDEQIAATPDGPEKQAAVEARRQLAEGAEKTRALVTDLRVASEQGEAALGAAIAGDTAAAVRIVGPAIAQRLPPQYGVYVLAGTTVLGAVLGYLEKRKKDKATARLDSVQGETRYIREDADLARLQAVSDRRAAASVITAIEYEKGGDEVVDFSNETTKASLRSRMSTEARDLVEQVRQAQPARLRVLKAERVTNS